MIYTFRHHSLSLHLCGSGWVSILFIDTDSSAMPDCHRAVPISVVN
jgi:hypothetical protein